MERLVRDMKDEGFFPGLWLARFTFTPNCELATKYPELVGEPWEIWDPAEPMQRRMFIKPSPVPDGVQYLEHAKLLFGLPGGFPCVSLLPDVFAPAIADRIRELCGRYMPAASV